MIYLAECTALAAIFSNFKRMVSIRCFRIFADNTSRLNQLNMLYARACTWTLFAFTIRLWLLTAAKSKPDLLSLMKISSCSRHNNDPSFCSVYSISDSLRNVSWSVLNYDTIIVDGWLGIGCRGDITFPICRSAPFIFIISYPVWTGVLKDILHCNFFLYKNYYYNNPCAFSNSFFIICIIFILFCFQLCLFSCNLSHHNPNLFYDVKFFFVKFLKGCR